MGVLRVGSRPSLPGALPRPVAAPVPQPSSPFLEKRAAGRHPQNQSRVGALPPAPTPALAVWQRETGGRFPRGQVWRSTPSRGFRGICSLASLSPLFHVPLDCVPALPSPTERPDHSGQSPPWAWRSARAAAHGQGTCWQGERPHPRQGMTPRPQHPGLRAATGPRSALTGCGRSAEPDSCFLEVAGVGAEGAAPLPASLTVDETQRSGAARTISGRANEGAGACLLLPR